MTLNNSENSWQVIKVYPLHYCYLFSFLFFYFKLQKWIASCLLNGISYKLKLKYILFYRNVSTEIFISPSVEFWIMYTISIETIEY